MSVHHFRLNHPDWAIAATLVGLATLMGCATSPRDFSSHSDGELEADFNETERKIRSAEVQYQALMNQAAQATNSEASMSAGFSAAAAGIQVKRLYSNRDSALAEIQKRNANHVRNQPSHQVASPAAPTEPDGTRIPYKSYPVTKGKEQSSNVETNSPQVSVRFPVYTGRSSGHRVTDNFSSGRFVVLEDQSVWQIDSFDKFDTALWLRTDSISMVDTVYKGRTFWRLVNVDTDEEVWAAYLGKAVLRSHVEDEFEGWEGDTILILDSGHVLEQVTPAFIFHYAYRPEVLVTKRVYVGQTGYYGVIVDGIEELVYVRELERR